MSHLVQRLGEVVGRHQRQTSEGEVANLALPFLRLGGLGNRLQVAHVPPDGRSELMSEEQAREEKALTLPVHSGASLKPDPIHDGDIPDAPDPLHLLQLCPELLIDLGLVISKRVADGIRTRDIQIHNLG